MTITVLYASSTIASAACGRGDPIHHAASAISRKHSREEAEERRWQLEWDRRNVED